MRKHIAKCEINSIILTFDKYRQINFRFKFESLNSNDFESFRDSKDSRFELRAQS